MRSRRINASDNEYVERLITNYRNREQLDGFPWLPETIDDGESLWSEVVFVARNRYLTQYAESTSATTTNINFNIPNSIFQNYTIDHQNAQVLETKQSILKDVVLKMEDSKVHYFVDDICNICMETINSSEIFALNCKHSFCYNCIPKIIPQGNCPCCRGKVTELCFKSNIQPNAFNAVLNKVSKKI